MELKPLPETVKEKSVGTDGQKEEPKVSLDQNNVASRSTICSACESVRP